MDNYPLLPFAFPNIKKVKYIIAAFYAPETDNNEK